MTAPTDAATISTPTRSALAPTAGSVPRRRKHVTQAEMAEAGKQREREEHRRIRESALKWRLHMHLCYLSGIREVMRESRQRCRRSGIRLRPATDFILREARSSRAQHRLTKLDLQMEGQALNTKDK